MRSRKPSKCIYCLEDKPGTKDHVVPKLLGRFKDAPTVPCVCYECNNGLGREIEDVFARDSFETLRQVEHGDRKQVGGPAGNRVVLRVPPGNDFEGALLELRRVGGAEPRVFLLPQVGVLLPQASDYQFHLEKEFSTIESLPKGTKFKVLAMDEDAYNRLLTQVCRLAPNFRVERGLDGPSIGGDGKAGVELAFTIDTLAFRVIAKIAFNYLAWKLGADVALAPTFHAIRSFIRYGVGERRTFAFLDEQPTLFEDTRAFRTRDSHLVTLTGFLGRREPGLVLVNPATTNPLLLVGRVALFNDLRYSILLTRDYRGLLPVQHGNAFDWRNRVVLDLLPGGLVKPATAV